WYLLTNLPRRRRRGRPTAATLAEIVRLYGLRIWVEQGYKQVKHELGWADFQVRSARAISRHLVLVCCAFSFCWHATRATPDARPVAPATPGAGGPAPPPSPPRPPTGRPGAPGGGSACPAGRGPSAPGRCHGRCHGRAGGGRVP